MAFAAMSFDVNEQLNQYLDEWKNDAPNENVIEILSKYLFLFTFCITEKSNQFCSVEFQKLSKRKLKRTTKWILIRLTTDIQAGPSRLALSDPF